MIAAAPRDYVSCHRIRQSVLRVLTNPAASRKMALDGRLSCQAMTGAATALYSSGSRA